MTEAEAKFEPLRFPEAQLQKALAQRLSFLEPLSRAYEAAVGSGGPWSIAALHRLALWALHFAEEVDLIEPPASLKGPALEKFRKDLRSVSIPLREKAKSTWNDAYSKAVAAGRFSPILPEIADSLSDFGLSPPGRAQGPKRKLHLAGVGMPASPQAMAEAFRVVREKLIKNAKDPLAWVDYGNLLWAEQKPLFSKMAYERAIALSAKNATALNNLAVVKWNQEGESWVSLMEVVSLLEESLKIDDFFLVAKQNLAILMNYYRIFPKAKSLWEQVLARSPNPEAQEGLAIALQGTGNLSAAENAFQKLSVQVKGPSPLVAFHKAARHSMRGLSFVDIAQGSEEMERCVDVLETISESSLQGFEKTAFDHLKGKCETWKTAR